MGREKGMIYTAHELFAFRILGESHQILNYYTTFCKVDPHEAGNRFIVIAEKIKAERAVVAMEAANG